MNSWLYSDGSEEDANYIPHDNYWDEKFEIEQDLKNQGFHK